MNRGVQGFDGVGGGARVYRSPPVRMSRYGAGKRYSIPHPFSHRPSLARPILTCRIAEGTYLVGEETLFTQTDSNQTTTGVAIIQRPDEIVIIWSSAGVGMQIQQRNGNTSFTTPANWDISFVVVG